MGAANLLNKMFRFFSSSESSICLSNEDKHHLVDVNRINIGECFEIVFNNEIFVYKVKSIKPFEITFVKKYIENSELSKQITIIFAISKGDKNETVVQKCTELGAYRIVFVPSERSIAKYDQKTINNKTLRFQAIAKEAAMQSHRLHIPEVIIISTFKDIENYFCDVNYLAYEKESKSSEPSFENILRKDVKSASVYIGSEGGVTEKEVGYLLSKNFSLVSLGNRILRCETAAIYAMSVISNILEK